MFDEYHFTESQASVLMGATCAVLLFSFVSRCVSSRFVNAFQKFQDKFSKQLDELKTLLEQRK
ncbi:MAG: hypothetical protein IJ642_10655 [Oscillospiraceae bacterium]|nr:hypothetical protein [Oscillospiraceae bacterium]